MGVGQQIYCKLTSIAQKYIRKFAVAFVSICAGNRRERSKVVKAMNITGSFLTFDRSRLLPALIENEGCSKCIFPIDIMS